MGQKVSAAACGSLMGMTYQPEANWAERNGRGGHHRLLQEWHHGSVGLGRASDAARRECPDRGFQILKFSGGGAGYCDRYFKCVERTWPACPSHAMVLWS